VPRQIGLICALGAASMLALGAPLCLAAPITPSGFVVENATPDNRVFHLPTGIAFFPDGRFIVCEKQGTAFIVDGTGTHQILGSPMILKVLGPDTGDRGLLGVAIDPNFNSNLYVYFLYTVDPDSNTTKNFDDHAYGRLVRYTLASQNSTALISPNGNSRAVLFGRNWTEGALSASETHTIGSLRWGSDGSLLVSCGEGAYWDSIDQGGNYPGDFGTGKTDPLEDVGAFRAQYLKTLTGKILRLDPATGLGYPSNPFWDGNGAHKQSKVFDYGLRNPFRFCVRPGSGSSDPAVGNPGVLYIGDVGKATWEELSVGTAGGKNFGWPCYEGTHQADQGYWDASPTHSGCNTVGTGGVDPNYNPSPHTPPISDWNHIDGSLSSPAGIQGNAATGSAFYTGSTYPVDYQGAYFYGDYGQDWIRVIQVDGSDNPVAFLPFGSTMDGPVDIVPNPVTGDLYYVAIFAGEVRRIRFESTGVEPQIRPFKLSAARPNPTRGRTSLDLELEQPSRVSAVVHDILGRMVWSSPVRQLPAGHWPITWDAAGMRAGVYLIDVEINGHLLSRRVTVLK
jgi:glucose/arabinose dehydrogenase